jgi:hypothetical protein
MQIKTLMSTMLPSAKTTEAVMVHYISTMHVLQLLSAQDSTAMVAYMVVQFMDKEEPT